MYTQIFFSPEIGTLQNKTTFAPGRPLSDSLARRLGMQPSSDASVCLLFGCCRWGGGGTRRDLRIYRSQGIPPRNSPYIPPAARSLLMSSRSQLVTETDGECILFFKSWIWEEGAQNGHKGEYSFLRQRGYGEIQRGVQRDRGLGAKKGLQCWLCSCGGVGNRKY